MMCAIKVKAINLLTILLYLSSLNVSFLSGNREQEMRSRFNPIYKTIQYKKKSTREDAQQLRNNFEFWAIVPGKSIDSVSKKSEGINDENLNITDIEDLAFKTEAAARGLFLERVSDISIYDEFFRLFMRIKIPGNKVSYEIRMIKSCKEGTFNRVNQSINHVINRESLHEILRLHCEEMFRKVQDEYRITLRIIDEVKNEICALPGKNFHGKCNEMESIDIEAMMRNLRDGSSNDNHLFPINLKNFTGIYVIDEDMDTVPELTGHYYIEMMRMMLGYNYWWKEILLESVRKLKKRKLPEELINRSTLSTIVRFLKDRLPVEYDLSIMPEDLELYYDLELVEPGIIFKSDDSLVFVIKIPLQRPGKDFLYESINIVSSGFPCVSVGCGFEVQHTDEELIKIEIPDKIFLIGHNTRKLHYEVDKNPVNCLTIGSGSRCRIINRNSIHNPSPCPCALFKFDFGQMEDACSTELVSKNEYRSFSIKHNNFVLHKELVGKIKVECGDYGDEDYYADTYELMGWANGLRVNHGCKISAENLDRNFYHCMNCH